MRPSPRHLRLATRGTSREINRRIALNLIRTNQPISRADLARLMGTRRGAVTLLVTELINEGRVFEGATGEAKRGRKPTFLYIDSRKRCVVAVDIRPTRTFVMVTDLVGQQLASVSSFPTERDPRKFIAALVKRIGALLLEHKDLGRCQGVGVVVPGMVESAAGRVLLAPNLGWQDVNLRDPIAAALKLPVQIENSGKACALAQLWATRDAKTASNFVYITVSDGLGVGIVLGGEVVRGQHNIAGEFGHVPLNIDGPRCGCGASGCWEAYVSNLATLSRYFGRDLRERPVSSDAAALTVDDLIARARGGDAKALAALLSTARYLGLGLGSVVNAIDPSHVYIGGEIIAAWDLIEATVRAGLAERALTASARATPIITVPPSNTPGFEAPPRWSPPHPSRAKAWRDGGGAPVNPARGTDGMADATTTRHQAWNWATVPGERLADGIVRQLVHGEKLMVCRLTIAPGTVTTAHEHLHEQMTIVEKGRVRFTLGSDERIFGPGDLLLMPSGLWHGATMLDEEVVLIDIFSPIREDFLKR